MGNNNIDHQESSGVQIFWSTDYSMFNWMLGNRDVNERKVKKIMDSVAKGLDLFRYNPILVNKDMYIIDGQHRFFVCQKMKLNVYYVIVPDFTLRDIAMMNNNTTKWSAKDFLGCYMDTGNEAYRDLDVFVKDYQLTLSAAINLLYAGKVKGGGGHASNVFRDGNFEIRYLDKAIELMIKSGDFKDFTDCYCDRAFLQAIELLLISDSYNHDIVLEKLRKHSLTISKKGSYKEYLEAIENAFNFHNSKRVTLY